MPDQSARAALRTVAALLAPAQPDVAARVTEAHDDPENYVRVHVDRMDERGIDEPIRNLAWIALVDALYDYQRLIEVDWKEDPRQIVGQLRTLVSDPSAGVWLDAVDTDHATFDFLELVGKNLLDYDTALVVLDIESDCYPLVLVPAGDTEELTRLAAVAGYTADVMGGAE